MAESLQRGYAGVKANLTGNAEKMPDADYTFKPGSMPEIRTFGALFMHVANAQYGECAAVKGVENPNSRATISRKRKRRRPTFVKALADSFAFCDDARLVRDERPECQRVDVRAGTQRNDASRRRSFGLVRVHDNEMFGDVERVPPRQGHSCRRRTERMQGAAADAAA